MPGIEDLRKLIQTGFLRKDVQLTPDIKVTLNTLSVADEYAVLDEAGLSDIPKTEKETLKFLPSLFRYVIKQVNGTTVTKDELKTVLASLDRRLLIKLFAEYTELVATKDEAGKEIKN